MSKSTDSEPRQKQLKVILLGDGAVGKTSIAQRFAGDGFAQTYKQTIGVDFFVKRIVLPGELHVTLQIWDIGGQSIGSKMLRNYVFGAHAVLLCYDMTNFESFANLEDWYKLVRQTFGSAARMPLVGVVANKCDLSHLRAVKSEVHKRFADENASWSFTMSAKSGDQVDSCFLKIAATLGVGHKHGDVEPDTYPVVKATIVEHKRHDDAVENGRLPPYKTNGRRCHVS
ncbi:hypothetical protein CTAYLR_004371 [Chrysophaeum taylorii]|uniref:Uncharacterized protein n=1 Tax=Chrysophaeum taylorii TaxID=2483200 RepID=A0AAD7XMH3_9STRA|nr:hypothetical protein CTAYLR_004371 [Chrysophaeum taylorii]